MIRIAIPNKGSLAEGATSILTKAGYQCRRSDKQLILHDHTNDIEFIFLRPKDIPIYVADKIVDAGISGRDLAEERGRPYHEVLALKFGRSRFSLACPDNASNDLSQIKRVASAYPNLAKRGCKQHGISAEIIELNGAVEISVQLGVADAIADIVSSGRTLRQHGLSEFGSPIIESEAILLTAAPPSSSNTEFQRFIDRLRGAHIAAGYVMIEYDIDQSALQSAVEIAKGFEAPTVSQLYGSDSVAVRVLVKRSEVNNTLDNLKQIGARAILASEIVTCRM